MKEQHMSKTPIPFTGGCVCGAVRYELTAKPILTLKCHCRDCQHITGSGFAPAFLVPAEAFRLTRGQLRYHLTPSIRRGKHKRGFCPECGSRITGGGFERGASPLDGVLYGRIDSPSLFQPKYSDFSCIAYPVDQTTTSM